MNTTARFKVLGISNDVTDCECCGRAGLKRTIRLGRLDAQDGTVAEVLYFGADCAARATRLFRTAAAMENHARGCQLQADEAASRRIVDVGPNPANPAALWVVESVGSNGGTVTRLCFARGLKSAIELWAAREYPNLITTVRKTR